MRSCCAAKSYSGRSASRRRKSIPGVSTTVYRQYRAGTNTAPGRFVNPSSSANGEGIVTSQSTQSSVSPTAGSENENANALPHLECAARLASSKQMCPSRL